MRKNKLRWFGHVMRLEETKAIRADMKMNVEGKRGREKPKMRRFNIIYNDMKAVGVYIGDA